MKSRLSIRSCEGRDSHVSIGLERGEILLRPSLQANPRSVPPEKQDLARI